MRSVFSTKFVARPLDVHVLGIIYTWYFVSHSCVLNAVDIFSWLGDR